MDQLVLAQDSPVFVDHFCETFYGLLAADTAMNMAVRVHFEKTNVLEYLESTPIYCPPNLPEVLVGNEPPSNDFFLGLPCLADFSKADLMAHYLLYAVSLEKNDEVPLKYVGSGAAKRGGAWSRAKNWDNMICLPMLVQKALENGYEIVHIGVLSLVDIPQHARQPVHRAMTLMSEADYTVTFWTMRQSQKKSNAEKENHYLFRLCPWELDSFDYRGLNTHSPMVEAVQNIELSMDELIQLADNAREKVALQARQHRAKVREALAAVEADPTAIEDPGIQKLIARHDAVLASIRGQREIATNFVVRVALGDLDKEDPDIAALLAARDHYLRQAKGYGDVRRSKTQQGRTLLNKKLQDENFEPDEKERELIVMAERDKKANTKRAKQRTIHNQGNLEVLTAWEDGELNSSDLDIEVQEKILKGMVTRKQRKDDADRRARGKDLSRKIDNGEIREEDLDGDELVALEKGRIALASDKKRLDRRSEAKKLARQVQKGEILQEDLDADDLNVLEKGRDILAKDKARNDDNRARRHAEKAARKVT